MALFPEGVSHSDPQMKPLKTGAARITLSAEREVADRGGRLGAVVVPVGLFYERKARFRSRVLLVVGEPVETAPLLPRYRDDERGAVDALTDELTARLDAVVVQAETNELLAGIARVARWTTERRPGAEEDELAADHQRTVELVGAYERLRARDPARVEAVAAQAREYALTLRRLGVRNPWGLEVELVQPRHLVAAVAKVVVALPLAVAGALMGWLPYRVAGVVAPRLSPDEEIHSTIKLLAGALFLLVAWVVEAVVVGILWSPWAIGPVFLLGVVSGYVALWFEELLHDTLEAVRHLWMRAFHSDMARRLGERRRALAQAVSTALREAA
jgi:hypothetical protein